MKRQTQKDRFREHNPRGRLTAQWESLGQTTTESPVLQWIVLFGLPCAHGAPTVEQTRFAHLNDWGKYTRQRSPATAINLVYYTMPNRELQTGHGFIDDTRRREAASEENGAKLLKSLCLGTAV